MPNQCNLLPFIFRSFWWTVKMNVIFVRRVCLAKQTDELVKIDFGRNIFSPIVKLYTLFRSIFSLVHFPFYSYIFIYMARQWNTTISLMKIHFHAFGTAPKSFHFFLFTYRRKIVVFFHILVKGITFENTFTAIVLLKLSEILYYILKIILCLLPLNYL